MARHEVFYLFPGSLKREPEIPRYGEIGVQVRNPGKRLFPMHGDFALFHESERGGKGHGPIGHETFEHFDSEPNSLGSHSGLGVLAKSQGVFWQNVRGVP